MGLGVKYFYIWNTSTPGEMCFLMAHVSFSLGPSLLLLLKQAPLTARTSGATWKGVGMPRGQ